MRALAQAPSAESPTHGNGSTFSFGAFAAMLVCAAAFLGIGASAASAAPEAQLGWSLQSTFGELSLFETTHNQLAVDSSGNIFASQELQTTARLYLPDGNLVGDYSLNGLPRNLAIDGSDDTVYVDQIFGGGVISRFVSDGAPTPTYTEDPGFSAPAGAGMVVDPFTGDLLVTDPGAEAVRRYDSNGTLTATISTPSLNPAWIAATPDGSFYIAPDGGADITHVSGTGTVLGGISGVGSVNGLAFEPTLNVVVASVGGQLKTYSAAGQFLSAVPASGAVGLASGGSGRLYGTTGESIKAFKAALVPGVEAPFVSDIEPTSVTVKAKVEPGEDNPGEAPAGSAAFFEYSGDGGQNWVSTPEQSLLQSGVQMVEAELTDLNLNSGYLVRIKAWNSLVPNGTTSSATAFSTPEIAPIVETGAASDRSVSGALLHGTVNPAGLQTSYHFEYGTTTAYGDRVPVYEAPAGNLRSPRAVERFIEGLQPATTYHYRLVAENSAGETAGADRTFTTLGSDEVFPSRFYEQVTPVDKRGAQVLSEARAQASADGSAIAVTTVAASQEAEGSRIRNSYLSRRGPSSWLDWKGIEAPQDVASGLFESSTAAVSPDFQHALVASNRVLAPGGIAGGGNLYVKDLDTGEYTFVAGAPGNDAYMALANIQQNEVIYIAGAPDFSWVEFWGIPRFLPEAQAPAIYRWSRTDGLTIESRWPDGTVPPLEVQVPTTTKLTLPSASTDGSVIAFGMGSGIYRRENGQTVPVSVSEVPGDPSDPVPGRFDWMTPDGRYVFFHTSVPLTDDAPPFLGNPYGYRYDAVTKDLVYTTLNRDTETSFYGASDDGQTAYIDTGSGTSYWHDGEELAITSDEPLSGNDGNQSYVTGNGRYFAWVDDSPGGFVHLYDAVADEAVCVSCLPDGSNPMGRSRILYGGRGISNRAARAVTEDGQLFFDTPSPLISADHNSKRDVYLYQDGRLTLISPGVGQYDAIFVDASDDGSSVFFQTDEGLVSQDTDGESDIYAARVGGGFASQNQPPGPAPCARADCGPVGADQVAAATPLGSMVTRAPERAKVSFGKVTLTAKAVRVRVRVNVAGTVRISGAGVKTTTRKLSGLGTYTISVPLTAAGERSSGAGKRWKVSLKAVLFGDFGSASAHYSRISG